MEEDEDTDKGEEDEENIETDPNIEETQETMTAPLNKKMKTLIKVKKMNKT